LDLPEKLSFERLDPSEKYLRAVPGYMRRLRDIYEAIHERFGEDGLDLIRTTSRRYGTRIGTNIRKNRELRGVEAVGRYLLKVFDMVSDDWEVTEYSSDRLVIRVSRCPYPFTNDKICRAHTCMEQALVESLDENLEYRIGRSIPRGDIFCEHILTVRNGS
jgi:hypothetical protein